MRDTSLQEGQHLVFVLGFLQLFVRSDVPDAQDHALLVVENNALEAYLDFEIRCMRFTQLSRGGS